MSFKEFCLMFFLGCCPVVLCCMLYAFGFAFLFLSSIHIVITATISSVVGFFIMYGFFKYITWLTPIIERLAKK